jgi:hypothetical protein
MEAPEKIYLQPISKNEIYNHWYRDKLTNDFIEYYRTDTFIEKACEWLKFNYAEFTDNTRLGIKIDELIKDFKQAMEDKK